MTIVVSGIQPTNLLHIGNYFGSIKNWVELQDQHQCMLFIADLHAITAPFAPEELKRNILNIAATYLACGIDPEKSTIFVQGTVGEHAQLAWLLNCLTPTGWMNRMTQFKEKSTKYKENSSLGLYCYPVLMAADILLYKADYVPVGEDQKQHLELTRDIAGAFNRLVREDYFTLPEPMILGNGARVMSLKDGASKMSKSDEVDGSRINLTDNDETIEYKIRRAKTDSIAEIYYDKEKRPEISNLLSIFASFSGKKIAEIEKQYHGLGSAAFKKDLADLVIVSLSSIRVEHKKLMHDTSYVMRVLTSGHDKIQSIATKNLAKIKTLLGIY